VGPECLAVEATLARVLRDGDCESHGLEELIVVLVGTWRPRRLPAVF
jgi:hypothetical protein